MDFLEGTKKTRVISERAIVLKHFDLFHINSWGSNPIHPYNSHLCTSLTRRLYLYTCMRVPPLSWGWEGEN